MNSNHKDSMLTYKGNNIVALKEKRVQFDWVFIDIDRRGIEGFGCLPPRFGFSPTLGLGEKRT